MFGSGISGPSGFSAPSPVWGEGPSGVSGCGAPLVLGEGTVGVSGFGASLVSGSRAFGCLGLARRQSLAQEPPELRCGEFQAEGRHQL